MFGKQKKLKEIEMAKQQLEQARQQLEQEKQQLLFIKEQLEDNSPEVDISKVYVWQDQGLYSIVRLDVQKIRGRNWSGLGRETDAYRSTLIDIFTNNVVYQKKCYCNNKPKRIYFRRNYTRSLLCLLVTIT